MLDNKNGDNDNDIRGCPICMRSIPSSTSSFLSSSSSPLLEELQYLLKTSCCKQTICKVCKEEWSKRSLRCPYCNETSSTSAPQPQTSASESVVVSADAAPQNASNPEEAEFSLSRQLVTSFLPACFTSVAVTAISLCFYLIVGTR
jgi:hypothetical protein